MKTHIYLEVIMGKRFLAIVLCLLFVSPIIGAGISGKFGIDLRGGASMFSPADFIADYEKTAQAFGYSEDNNIAWDAGGIMPGGGALIKYFATPNVGIYLRSDFSTISNEFAITGPAGTDWENEELIVSTAAFATGYFGIGVKYYLGFDAAPGLFLSIGADGGAFIHYQSFWEVWTDPNSTYWTDPAGYASTGYDRYVGKTPAETDLDNYNAYSVTDFQELFVGGNVELGLDYLMNEKIGINVHVGYKIAPMTLAYPDTGIWFEDNNLTDVSDANSDPIFVATTVDFSGLYFGAGLVINFGGDDKKSSASQGSKIDSTGSYGGASKYEKYGDYYYKMKKYSAALKYYGAARKQTPKRAELYKKMGFCYYYTKNNAYAKKYLTYYLKLNPSDTKIRNWVGKIR
jgi:hypothetical protein